MLFRSSHDRGVLTGNTVTFVVSFVGKPFSSATRSSKTNILTLPFATTGAVNVGSADSVSDSSTFSPPTCFQVYVRESLSGSSPVPASVTSVCSSTTWSAPASADALTLSDTTVTTAESVSCPPYGSVTVNSNSNSVD